MTTKKIFTNIFYNAKTRFPTNWPASLLFFWIHSTCALFWLHANVLEISVILNNQLIKSKESRTQPSLLSNKSKYYLCKVKLIWVWIDSSWKRFTFYNIILSILNLFSNSDLTVWHGVTCSDWSKNWEFMRWGTNEYYFSHEF